MDRQIVYPGQIPLETDLLNSNKYAMVGLAKLAAAMLGTATVVNGLACVPTGPASLQVVVNPGEMYSLVATDASAYSSLSADAHNILKQGISLDPVTLSCPAPATAGQSINYLIQAAYQDQDTGLVTLPYYNASNPSQAWSGPNNSGTQQATARKGVVTISAKAGIAAATGSQTTPAPDAGFTGLWVVTVANGQTQITSANIGQALNAPILPSDLLHSIQSSGLIVGVDVGAANACVVNFPFPVTALTDGMPLWFKAKAANTGATTINIQGLGAIPLVGGAHTALQGGELVANGRCLVVYRQDINSCVLIECTGGAVQVAPATKSQHAPQFGQFPAVVGSMRNARMSVPAASATATFTADEIVVESALGGLAYRLANFSQIINLGNVGAGGMDTGSSPASGFVALYAIYNPITQAQSIIAVNATSAAAPNVYGGANMPAGYTASALIGVWPTNGAGQFNAGYQADRSFFCTNQNVLTTSTQQASFTSLTVSSAIPQNARAARGYMKVQSTGAGDYIGQISGSTSGIGATLTEGGYTSTGGAFVVPIITAQTIFYAATVSVGTMTATVFITGYDF